MRILMENLEILKNLFLFNGMKEKQIEAALNKLESEEKKYRKKSSAKPGFSGHLNHGRELGDDDLYEDEEEYDEFDGDDDVFDIDDVPSFEDISLDDLDDK